MTGKTTGQVFNIQRYSIHDGAGIRTLVFLKGCPLRCLWCCNPESQKPGPEIGLIASHCAGVEACGGPCLAACPASALGVNAEGKAVIDRQRCDNCGRCAGACPKGALKLVGREMKVEEVMAEVEKDRAFYRRSGGGMTVGGGEPLAQPEFAAGLLEAAQNAYLHTALETCGHAPWGHFEAVLRHVDLLQFDLKHIDPLEHRHLTGQSNELILSNLERVLSVKVPRDVIVRFPVVPGYTDTGDIREMARYMARLGFVQMELIPYHRLGVSKYAQYGMVYSLAECDPPSQGMMDRLKEVVENMGLVEMSGKI